MTYHTDNHADMLTCARTAIQQARRLLEVDPKLFLSLTHKREIKGLLKDLRVIGRLDRQRFAEWNRKEDARQAAQGRQEAA